MMSETPHTLLGRIRKMNLVPWLMIYFAVGVAGLVFPATRPWFIRAVPFTLLLSLGLVVLHHRGYSLRFWLSALLVFSAGLILEIVGVTTGLLFGQYSYGPTLGPAILHTPLLIGVNWLLLIYCTLHIAGRFVDDLFFRSLAAASMMVMYDIVLEPAAMRLDMWSWTGGAVPLQNYLAWFGISVLLAYVSGRTGLAGGENKLAVPLFFIQMGFFLILDVWIVAERLWA
jgi:putative membrane protein